MKTVLYVVHGIPNSSSRKKRFDREFRLVLPSVSESIRFSLQVFFDMSIGGKPIGRIVMGMFGEMNPITVNNFVQLSYGKV